MRKTLISDSTYTVRYQKGRLQSYGCDEIITDNRLRLSKAGGVVCRLDALGVWDVCEKATYGGELVSTDSTRIIKSYSEVPALINKLNHYEMKLIFLRDGFNSERDVMFVNILERCVKVEQISEIEARKSGYLTFKQANSDRGIIRNRSLLLCSKIAADIEFGKSIVEAAASSGVNTPWIYWKGLQYPEVRLFILNLSSDEMSSDSTHIHREISALTKDIKKNKKKKGAASRPSQRI